MIALLRSSDAAVVLAGACLLIGWLSGMAMMLCLFWRRLTHDPADTLRLTRTVQDQDRVLAGLYQQNARLAALYTAARADETRHVGEMAAGKGKS